MKTTSKHMTSRVIDNSMLPSAQPHYYHGTGLLINARYGSLNQYSMNSEDQFLRTTIRAMLMTDPADLLMTSSLLTNPALRETVGTFLTSSLMRPVETKVPLMTYSTFRDTAVKQAVRNIIPTASQAVCDLLTYIFGKPAVKAGFVIPDADMVSVVRSERMFPDYSAIRQRLVTRLIHTYVKKYDLNLALPTSGKITAPLLFRSMIDDLHALSRDIIAVATKLDRFDEIAALALLRVCRDPEHLMDASIAPLLEIPEVVAFANNATLIYAANIHFATYDAVIAQIPLAGVAAVNAREYDGLVDMVITHEDFKRISLEDLKNKTDVVVFRTLAGRPTAVGVAPKLRQRFEAAISFIPVTSSNARLILTPMKAPESQLQGLGDAILRMVDRPLFDFRALLNNIGGFSLDAMAVDFSLSSPSQVEFDPTLFTYGFTNDEQEQYLWYLAQAFGAQITLAVSDVFGEADGVFTYGFQFTPVITDAVGYLQMKDRSTAITTDAATTLLYSQIADSGVHSATDGWDIVDQTITKANRIAILTDTIEDPLRALSPDAQNRLDREDMIRHVFRLSTDEELVYQGSAYDLLSGGAHVALAAASLVAHDHMMLRLCTDRHLMFLADLYDTAADAENVTAQHQVSTVAASTVAELLKTPVVRMACRVVLSTMVRTIRNPIDRLAIRAVMNDPMQTQTLRFNVLMMLLQRASLLSHDVAKDVSRSALFSGDFFNMTLASLLPSDL